MLVASALIYLTKRMIQKVLFDKRECRFLRSFIERNDIIKTTKDARGTFNTTVVCVPTEEVPNWFNEKIKQLGIKDLIFENKLAASRAVIINRYGTKGYFARHRDDYALEDHWKNRYKTMIVQLSEPNSYSGGDLLVEDKAINRTIGNVAMFNSSAYHELTTIEEGERYSLILWLDRDDVIEKRSIL